MRYIILECRDTSVFKHKTSEEQVVELLWESELHLGNAQIVACGGNANIINRISELSLEVGDSLYIHYDTINIYMRKESWLLFKS